MQIDVFHDTVCPWCRIGKQNLKLALAPWQDESV
jgi:predicted DsbA family dithiol-disulfide isomerase